MSVRRRVIALVSLLALGGCAGMGAPAPPAAEAVRPLNAARTYSGVWRVYALSAPAKTSPCLLTQIEFLGAADGDVFERDVCQDKGGRLKTVDGRLTIDNPGLDTRYMVRYRFLQAFYVPQSFVILAHGGQYRWMIRQSRPEGDIVAFIRPDAPTAEVAEHIDKALKTLGLDPAKLTRPPVSAAPAP